MGVDPRGRRVLRQHDGGTLTGVPPSPWSSAGLYSSLAAVSTSHSPSCFRTV